MRHAAGQQIGEAGSEGASTPPFDAASRVFKALGHPLRLRLVCGLCREPSSLSRIHEILGGPISTLAQHIAVLRRNGILQEERRGPEIFLRVEDAQVRLLLETLCPHGESDPPVEWAWDRLGAGHRA